MRPPAAEKSWLAGLRQFRFCFLRLFRCGRFKSGKDEGRGTLDNFQALGQEGRVSVVQVDVIRLMLSST